MFPFYNWLYTSLTMPVQIKNKQVMIKYSYYMTFYQGLQVA